jgi:2-keto-4-pentenoate hydratase/2-oxohepta-3-ene-1,7-dioic acid hydratase in catechol pathway
VKLATFQGPDGTVHAGEVREERVVAFDDGSSVVDRLATGDRSSASGASFTLDEVTLLAPVPRPRAIFGIGLNYAAHAAEQGQDPPERPIVFMKLPTSAAAPGGPVLCPEVVKRLDYEGELGVVMGAGGTVAGYCVCDDVSARDLQRAEPQWTRAKGADTFCPYGPWITTADDVPDPEDLRLRTWVNGELRQDARTSDLVFGVEHLVAFLRETITLAPGR